MAPLLDRSTEGGGGYELVISDRVDRVREVRRGYGKDGSRRPGDYLDSFRQFIQNNISKLPALLVVTQRPWELTREDLRQLKLALDQEGFNEQAVQTAWREQKSEDIAASIIGYIRQLALGAPLIPIANASTTRCAASQGAPVLGDLADETWKDAG